MATLWAGINAGLVALDFFIIAYGLYLAKVRKDYILHSKVMITAGVVFLVFLISFLLKVLLVGVQEMPVWEGALVQPRTILIIHEVVALITVPLLIATYWFAFKGQFERHKRIAPWAGGSWLFESAFGIVEFYILYFT